MNFLEILVVTGRVVFCVIVTKFVIVRFPKDVEFCFWLDLISSKTACTRPWTITV